MSAINEAYADGKAPFITGPVLGRRPHAATRLTTLSKLRPSAKQASAACASSKPNTRAITGRSLFTAIVRATLLSWLRLPAATARKVAPDANSAFAQPRTVGRSRPGFLLTFVLLQPLIFHFTYILIRKTPP